MSYQKAPSSYMPSNQAGADQAFQTGASSLLQGGQTIQNLAMPGFQQLYSGALTNPYYGGAQANAGQVAALGQTVGQNDIGLGNQLSTLGGQMQSYIPGVLATGFDPQGALYNQQYTANQQQQAAIDAMNGVSGSPYAAGVMGQSGQNFNLNWQNNLQGRELAALSGASGLASTTSGLDQAGAGLAGQGLQTMFQTGQLPNQTYTANQNQIGQMLAALVSGDTSAFNLTQQAVGDQGTYLGIGQNATQLDQNAAQINNKAASDFWGGIGSLFGDVLGGGFGNIFSGVGSLFGGGGGGDAASSGFMDALGF